MRDGRLEVIEFLEQRPAAVEVAYAGLGERQVPRGAVDQPGVQVALEHRDRTRDECIGHAEMVRRAPEALLLGDADEYTHGLNLVHGLRIFGPVD